MKKITFVANRRAGMIGLLAALLVVVAMGQGGARTGEVANPGIRYGRTPSGYIYIHGGSSARERSTLERIAAPYNVKLVLVRPPAMLFSQLRVLIANNHSGKIENISPSGPWIYLQLPAGSYTIGARIRNQLFILRDVHVRDARRQTHVIRGDLLPLEGH